MNDYLNSLLSQQAWSLLHVIACIGVLFGVLYFSTHSLFWQAGGMRRNWAIAVCRTSLWFTGGGVVSIVYGWATVGYSTQPVETMVKVGVALFMLGVIGEEYMASCDECDHR